MSVKTTNAQQMAHVLHCAAEMQQLCLSRAALIEGQKETWYAIALCQPNRKFTAVKRIFAMANMSLVRTQVGFNLYFPILYRMPLLT